MSRWSAIRSVMLATSALAPLGVAPATANPNGPNVVGGAATVSGVGTASVTVNQSSHRAILNWNTFNIGAGETTRFVQPSASSVALNRVTGNLGPSQLYGTLSANGRVFLVNPDGILVGRGAVIDTAGFLATTHDIRNDDFMAGRYRFNIPGRPDASVVNEGTITAHSHGFAALVAPGVRNSGTITAKFGKIGLAAGNGFSLDLYGDQLITLAVGDSVAATVRDVATGQPLGALVKNDGKLKANGGRVELTAASARAVVDSVINNSGVIEARSIGHRNGKIVLGGPTAATKVAGAPTQTVKVSGTLSTASKRGKGGAIQVTGEAIEIKAASFDASGATGGGTVLIGGDTGGGHGHWAVASIPQAALEAGAVPNATTVSIDAATTINASATSVGDGGKVIVWADDTTVFAGKILARGGDLGGNGGFSEVSGKQTLTYAGTTDLRAPYGTFGTQLLDPLSFTIGGVTGANSISVGDLVIDLNMGNKIITNNVGGGPGDILVTQSFGAGWTATTTLTLNAFGSVIFSDGAYITNTAGGSLVVRADSSGSGTGTINLTQNTSGSGVNWTGSTGFVRFYENPPGGYSNPTDFTPTGQGGGSRGVTTNSAIDKQFISYMLVNSITDLQNVVDPGGAALRGSYALGKDFAGGAFTTHTFTFRGDFDGLNRTISGLAFSGPGLFQANDGTFRNLTLSNATVNATANDQFVGLLVGQNNATGKLINVHTSGTVNGNGNAFTGVVAGGVVGQNNGDVIDSTSSATVSGSTLGIAIGGLAGANSSAALIRDSSASGAVTTTASVPPVDCMTMQSCPNTFAGGLVGNNQGTIEGVAGTHTAFATGPVSVGSNGTGGGLVGFNSGSITNAKATGAVTGAAGVPGSSDQFDKATILGGLVGTNQGSISASRAEGNVGVAGVNYLRLGGLVGDNTGLIGTSEATGNVVAGNFAEAGGFVGAGGGDNCMFLCGIGSSTAGGSVTVGSSSIAGGFSASGEIIGGSHATGAVTGGADSILGGFVGINNLEGIIFSSSASGPVTSTGPNSWVGGFVGYNGGLIVDANANGGVNVTSSSIAGGFFGMNIGWIAVSAAHGTVSASGSGNVLGGFGGVNFGTVDSSSSTGSVSGAGANIAGSFLGANASFINFPQGQIALSSFPVGTSTNSAGSAGGPQIGVTNPRSLPNHPAIIASCDDTMCVIFQTGKLGSLANLIPDEVRAVPNLLQTLNSLDKPDTSALIQIKGPTTAPDGQPSGSPRPSQVPGTLPASSTPNFSTYSCGTGTCFDFAPMLKSPHKSGELIVPFPAGTSPAALQQLAERNGLTVLETFNVAGNTLVRYGTPSGVPLESVMRNLQQQQVASPQPTVIFQLMQAAPAAAAAPTVATARRGDPAQYMTGKLHLSDAHNVASGRNVTVAVIDSEVDREHSELSGTIAERFDATESDSRAHSHGTAMAGAIVSRDRLLGVAPGARILAVRAFSETQTSAESTTFPILKGIEWAVSQGARVINMSFAGPYDPSLERALKDAAAKGVVLIAASGNAGPKSAPLWPGADPNVIAVTATDSGDKLFRQANRGPYVSVASPGVEILAPAPQAGYQMSTGTSIATAHVSGVVALMLERDPTLTPRDVRLILEATANDLGPKGRDTQYGWGLVNPAKALAMVDERKRQKGSAAAPPVQR